MGAVDDLLKQVYQLALEPIIVLLFVVAMLVFFWGLIELIRGGDSPEARETGRRHILWGAVGLAIMLSVFGITRLLSTTYGLNTGPGIDGDPQDQIFR